MSLDLKQKKAVVAEINAIAASAQTAIAAEYIGLTVAQMTELRAKAREQAIQLRVVKNSLARRAVIGTDFECLMEILTGPLLLVFSAENPGAGARLIRDFSKANERLVTKAIAFAGELRPAHDLVALATMPTLDEARAQLLGMLKAPQAKLVRTLAEPTGQLVRVLVAYKDTLPAA